MITSLRFFTVVAGLVASLAAEVPEDSVFEQEFGSSSGGEATAVIHASCTRCAWGERGREAAAVRISIDGAYSQHLLLARGADVSDTGLPSVQSRRSAQIRIEPDEALSAAGAGHPVISQVDVDVAPVHDEASFAQSLAPFSTRGRYRRTVHRPARADVVRGDEDGRGKQFRYSVIFTNEDGGTATDRLMATWGRTTDIDTSMAPRSTRRDRSLPKSSRVRVMKFQPFEAATTETIR